MLIEIRASHVMLRPRTWSFIAWKCIILCVIARTEEGKETTVPCMHQLTRVPTCPDGTLKMSEAIIDLHRMQGIHMS